MERVEYLLVLGEERRPKESIRSSKRARSERAIFHVIRNRIAREAWKNGLAAITRRSLATHRRYLYIMIIAELRNVRATRLNNMYKSVEYN